MKIRICNLSKGISFIFSWIFSLCIFAQNVTIKGIVTDNQSNPLPGVTITITGTTKGVITDNEGFYSIEARPTDRLQFSFVGFEVQIIDINDQTTRNIVLEEKIDELEEVTIVAFGKQKKESVISSITAVNTKDLKVPSSNLTTSFAGRIAGMISYQRSGEPGSDDAEFFIRGITTFGSGKSNPLILIDGVESEQNQLSRMTPDNIASFSVMKDATATALYGARGANGVILVTTKQGIEGKTRVSLRSEFSLSTPTEMVKIADPITFMELQNEATRTRNPLIAVPFSLNKIYNTAQGNEPLMYPAIDWHDYLIKDHTINQRHNITISGGGPIARYFIGGEFTRDEGIFKENSLNNFNNNSLVERFNLFSNVNMNITKSTLVTIRFSAQFDETKGPVAGGDQMFYNARNASPVLFHPYYEPDEDTKFLKHILFGNAGETGNYLNPYAELVKGYRQSSYSIMSAQVELNQGLDFLAPGLSARGMMNFKRASSYSFGRSTGPFWYKYTKDASSGKGMLVSLNKNGRDFLSFDEGGKYVNSQIYGEAAIQYNQNFKDKHNIGGLLVTTISEFINGNAGSLLTSLPRRNIGIAGRLSYDYGSRYFIEGNFGYNGSERFAKSNRWGFFPSIGLGWIVSNEQFWHWGTIEKLKFKGTYGLVGNDQIGNVSDRFFYISQVSIGDAPGYTFGSEWREYIPGDNISRYGDDNITWEVAHKMNAGIELNLWGELEIQADYFHELRSKILQYRSYIPETMGLQTIPSSNIGEAEGYGTEIQIDFNHSFHKDFWLSTRGTFTYATSKYKKYEEPDYSQTMPWLQRTGQKLSQVYGYVAERLFVDEEEVKNSPIQFGKYMAGDIKYRDINNDGRITEQDIVPIGYPSVPEIIYGFGASMGYRNFDFSFFVQGSARSSFIVEPGPLQPFINGTRAIVQFIADNHWSEDNRNSYAFWPRLSTNQIENNTKASTWWLRDGSFLRLKTVELGYSIPERIINKVDLSRARVYLNGNNLTVLSAFKLWDPERSTALGYPLQRVINLGINVEF